MLIADDSEVIRRSWKTFESYLVRKSGNYDVCVRVMRDVVDLKIIGILLSSAVDGLAVIRNYDVCVRVIRNVDDLKIILNLLSSGVDGFYVIRMYEMVMLTFGTLWSAVVGGCRRVKYNQELR